MATVAAAVPTGMVLNGGELWQGAQHTRSHYKIRGWRQTYNEEVEKVACWDNAGKLST